MTPTLSTHDRKAIVNQIDAATTRAIVATFGVHSTPPAEGQVIAAQGYLRWLHGKDWWLACSCRTSGAQPLMAPRMRENQLHVVRHGSVTHANDCLMRMTSLPSTKDHSSNETMGSWSGPLLLLKPDAVSSSHSKDSKPSSSGVGTGKPAFARYEQLLDFLIDTAQLNVLAFSSQQTESTADIVKDRYGAFDLLNDLPVAGDLVWKQVTEDHLERLKRHFFRLKELKSCFPANVRPQGYFFGVVDDISAGGAGRSSKILIKNYRAKNEARSVEIDVPAVSGMRPERGPYLVIAAIGAKNAESRFFEIVHAHAIGIVNKRELFPVRSSLERSLVRTLISTLRTGALEEPVSIQKSLSIEDASRLTCWIGSRRVDIEFEEGDLAVVARKGRLEVRLHEGDSNNRELITSLVSSLKAGGPLDVATPED